MGCSPGASEPDEFDPYPFSFDEDGGYPDEQEAVASLPPAVCRLSAPSSSSEATELSEGPNLVELPARQLLAVGYVKVHGLPCSGTLVAPGWVLTAKHCVDAFRSGEVLDPVIGELEFLTGADPDLADLRSVARAVYHHPENGVDLSLIELSTPSGGSLPDISPILLSRQAELDEGGLAEAAGYGIGMDGLTGRRRFVAESILEWTDTTIDVLSTSEESLCFGDSGGPLLMRGAEGEPRLVGTLWKGSSDCSGHDRFARVDAHLGWIESVLGKLATECASASNLESCDGRFLSACADGVERMVDCGRCGLVCRIDQDDAFCASEAGSETPNQNPGVAVSEQEPDTPASAEDAGIHPPLNEAQPSTMLGDAQAPPISPATDAGAPFDSSDSGPEQGTPRVLQSEPASGAGIELHSQALAQDPTLAKLPLSFLLTNNSTEPLELSGVALRYYYSQEGNGNAAFVCELIEGVDCRLVLARHARLQSDTGLGGFVEITFNTGSTLGANSSMEIRGGVVFDPAQPQDQTDDFSFLASKFYTHNPRISVFREGRLVWGAPPPALVVQAETGAPVGNANVSGRHAGFTGAGKVENITTLGSGVVNIEVTAPNAGPTDLFIRYANGSKFDEATIGLLINRTRQTTARFTNTGSWSSWSTTSATVNLEAGPNRVDFIYEEGDTGTINLDFVWIEAGQ